MGKNAPDSAPAPAHEADTPAALAASLSVAEVADKAAKQLAEIRDAVPKRPFLEVESDLKAARQEYNRLQKLNEKEYSRVKSRERAIEIRDRIRARMLKQGLTEEDLDADPAFHRLQPLTFDSELGERYHRVHYRIADLEAEMGRYSASERGQAYARAAREDATT